jgi:hypothetical protein
MRLAAPLALAFCLLGFLAPADGVSASVFARGPHLGTIRSVVTQEGVPLPDRLVIPPGHYQVGGRIYDMNREGYYEIGQRRHRIVYLRSIHVLLSGIAWATTGEGRDDTSDVRKLAEMAMTREPSLSAGYLVELTRYLLEREGIESRAVASLGSSPDAINVMIEVNIAGLWTLYDPRLDVQPTYDERATTIVGVQRRDQLSFRPLTRGAELVPFGLLVAARYRESSGTALVSDSSQTWPFYFSDARNRERVSGYYPGGYVYLPPKAFYARFYPGGTAIIGERAVLYGSGVRDIVLPIICGGMLLLVLLTVARRRGRLPNALPR